MSRELVLLSDIPLTPDLMAHAARGVIPDGTGVSYRDGEVTQFLDAAGRPVLTVFDAMPVHVPEEAAVLLQDPPVSFALWTDITVPFAASPASSALADALAGAVGGTLREKR
ncbi:MAG: hypothetical protein QM713_10020 [Arachnia sp.]